MSSTRLPRFRRRSDVIRPFQLTARDREIIRLIHRHRFLRSSHLVSLLTCSRQQLLRRLQLLFHHGYLERPSCQMDYYHEGGSKHLVYGLGPKGAAFLKRVCAVPFHRLDWGVKNQKVKKLFLEHALMVSDFMVNLEMKCRDQGKVRVIYEDALPLPDAVRSQRDPFTWNVRLRNGEHIGVRPDRVFALERLDGYGFDRHTLYCLEADRCTMPVERTSLEQSSLLRKVQAYDATARQHIHQQRFGFHHLQIVIATTGKTRATAIRTLCQFAADKKMFIVRGSPDTVNL